MTAIFNFLMIAGSIQGFVFNIATFLSRKKIEKPVLFLNLFVLFLSLNNLQSWLIDKGFIAFNYYTLPFYVLLAPMFHSFLIYYLEIERKRRTYFMLTALIFTVELLARIVIIYLVRSDSLNLNHVELYNAIEDAITLVFSIFIFYQVLGILFKFERLYATILTFDDLKWVKRLIQLGGIVLLLWGVAVVLNFVSETIKAPFSYYPLRLGTSIFIYWIGYQGFFRFVILQDRIGLRRKMRKDGRTTTTVYREDSEDQKRTERKEGIFNNVNDYILTNQKYLDPYLSLEKLAEELDTSTSSLSKLINSYAGSNFPDYINSLRIEESKKLLSDTSFSPYTILAIGLECGFNSKSTFYSAFKKFAGQTPTAYRNKSST
ncbi:MAG: helix-turn-helix transcriptional regulator [Maribacter sp.]